MSLDTIAWLRFSFAKLLSYSFAGFLLVVLVYFLYPAAFGRLPEQAFWQVVVVAAIVLGAGIHVLHRMFLVPIHHSISVFLWWVYERGIRCRRARDSVIPPVWLGTLKVSFFRRIPAYSTIRHSEPFKDMEDRSWDLFHTELGLVVLTGEALIASALAMWFIPSLAAPPVDIRPIILAGVGAALWLLPCIPAYFQHRNECLLFKARKEEVKWILEETGFKT